MSDDLDALLARADLHMPSRDLRRAVESLRADYLAALDVIARLTEGWDAAPTGDKWRRNPFSSPSDDPMSDREWRVYCDAAQRATHPEDQNDA